MTKRNKVIGLIIIILILGFIRESFFVNLNAQINTQDNPANNFKIVGWTSFLSQFSTPALIKLKWLATVVFSLFFFGLTYLLVKAWFGQNEYNKFPALIFGGVFILSGIAIGVGKLFPTAYSNSYFFSRWLMGATQSPLLPAIICILIYYINLQRISKKTN